MQFSYYRGRRAVVILVAAFALSSSGTGALLAAACPTVLDPGKLKGAYPEQVEIDEAKAAGLDLTFTDNPCSPMM